MMIRKEKKTINRDEQAAKTLMLFRSRPLQDKYQTKLQVFLLKKLQGQFGQCSRWFKKVLTGSDVKDDQRRLLLNDLIYKDGIKPLLRQHDDPSRNNGVNVIVYDHKVKEYEMVV